MLPGIFRRLFANNGVGPLLRTDIIPWAEKYDIAQYYPFQDEMPRPGMIPCMGLVVEKISKYPQMIAYLNTSYGQKRLVTKAEYDKRHVAFWHTCADGKKIGWDGEGGVNVMVWDKTADTLLTPDLSGMAGVQTCSSLGVGGVQGDAGRNITGMFGVTQNRIDQTSGAFSSTIISGTMINAPTHTSSPNSGGFDASRVMPTGPRFQTQGYGHLLQIYIGQHAS